MKVKNVSNINDPIMVKPDVKLSYSNNVEENSIHVIKIFFLTVLIVLLLYNLYQYFIGEKTLIEKILNLFRKEEPVKEKPKNKKPIVKGAGFKKNTKKKKNDEINMDVKELALMEKLNKLPQSELNKALEVQDSDKPENKPIPSPDLSSESDIQNVKKTGYCYIGSEGNKRFCINVKTNDKCMSGEVYPSMDLCINPNLRT